MFWSRQGILVAKDKKKKDKKGKSATKGAAAFTKIKAMSDNPLVVDVVAAALVATAAALKDSNKARALASHASDELTKLSKSGASRGNAMWQLALDIGRRSLEAVAETKPKSGKKTAAKRASKPGAKAVKTPSAPKSKAAAPKTKPRRKASSAK